MSKKSKKKKKKMLQALESLKRSVITAHILSFIRQMDERAKPAKPNGPTKE